MKTIDTYDNYIYTQSRSKDPRGPMDKEWWGDPNPMVSFWLGPRGLLEPLDIVHPLATPLYIHNLRFIIGEHNSQYKYITPELNLGV